MGSAALLMIGWDPGEAILQAANCLNSSLFFQILTKMCVHGTLTVQGGGSRRAEEKYERDFINFTFGSSKNL